MPAGKYLRGTIGGEEVVIAATTFLVIGLGGMALLLISAFLGGDDADFETEADFDLDTEVDADVDVDTGAGAGAGMGILQWFSVKAVAVAAVGFGFMGWALSTGGSSAALVWTAAVASGLALWVLSVIYLFPWLRRQQGDDLQSAEAYQGLEAEIVVRIPAGGVGQVQFTDPSGAVVRRDARAADKGNELAVGKRVLIVLATAEHVTVDQLSLTEEIN